MVNVGVIGYGYWGPNLVRNFNQIKASNLIACCDLAEEKIAKIKQLYPKVKVTNDYDMVIKNPDIEAIVVASTAATHYELAKKALKANKHVFVEKPLALNSREASELVKLAKESKRVLMVGHLLKYHPAINYIKNYIESGGLGRIQYLYSQRLNLGKLRKDENALWSLAPHDISVILYLLGDKEPIEVAARGESYIQSGIEDVVFCSLHFDNRVMAHIHISWLDPHKIRKLTIVGSKKMAVFDDMQSSEKVRIFDKGVETNGDYRSYGEDLALRFGDIIIPSIKMEEPLRIECEHFISCILNGQKPISDGEDGLRVVKVLEAAQKSLESGGQPVKI
jgi:predicted dehydrogenase